MTKIIYFDLFDELSPFSICLRISIAASGIRVPGPNISLTPSLYNC